MTRFWPGVLAIGGAVFVFVAIATSVAATLVLHRYDVPSESMTPTLNRGDSFWTISFGTAHRGDVVVIAAPASVRSRSSISKVVTREVAVGGDVIEAHDGKVFLNGSEDVEPYLAPGTTTRDITRTEVPSGTIYVLGDNRENSQGSFIYGPIPTSAVEGRLVVTNPPPTLLIYAITAVVLVLYVGYMERRHRSAVAPSSFPRSDPPLVDHRHDGDEHDRGQQQLDR
jgi:signal peptidase I